MPLTDLPDPPAGGAWGGEPIDSVTLQGGHGQGRWRGKSTTMALSSFRNRLNHEGPVSPRRRTHGRHRRGNLPQVVPSVWMTRARRAAHREWTAVVGATAWGWPVGAKGKADGGFSYEQILSYYYGGLSP